MSQRTPRELLTPAALHILLTLAQNETHGYAIKQAIEERTGGKLSLGPATLYEAIHRMHEAEWIDEVPSPGRKRVYRITPPGRRVLHDELRRLRDIVAFARDAELLEADS